MRFRPAAFLGLLVLCLVVLWPARGSAKTWRVWKDGSGDYTVIQDAVDAAAPGDTVLIGPGRYTESSIWPYDGEGIEGETFVGIDKDDLTLMGVHPDSVVIGPWEPDFQGFLPKGIAMQYQGSTRVRIQDITVRNVREGLRLGGVAWVSRCVLDSCDIGIFGVFEAAIEADSCRMTNCFDQGALFARGISTIIRDCEVVGNASNGLNFIQCQDAEVLGCVVRDSRLGIHYQQASSGTIDRCHLSEVSEGAVSATLGSMVEMFWSTAEGGEEGVFVSASTFVGERNRLGPFTLYLMNMLGDSDVTMTHNDFILGPTPSMRLDGYLPEAPTIYLDFTNNWWGTIDPEVIAGQILDKNDDDTIDGIVVFEPLRTSTAPTEVRSFGELKALFGGR